MFLRAVMTAGERQDQRIPALEFAQRADRAGVVGQRVVGEGRAWGDVRTHGSTASQFPSDSSRGPDGCLDVVVDADGGQQAVRAAFVDAESRLGGQVVTAPADAVVFQGAAHPVVGHRAGLQADAAACAEPPLEELAEFGGAAVGGVRADGLAEVAIRREGADDGFRVTGFQRGLVAADDITRTGCARRRGSGGRTYRRPSTGHWLQ